MKKYLYLLLICFFTNPLSSYNLNLPVENATWREFLFVKSREKKNPSFLQMGVETGKNSYSYGYYKKIFLSFQQDFDKLYFKLFLPFGQFSYFNSDGELIKNFVSDDIGVICGYKVVKNKSTDLSFNLGFTVPTSSGLRQKGDIGLGVDLSRKFWKNRLRFDVVSNYRYLFGYSKSTMYDVKGLSLLDTLFNFSLKIKQVIFDVGLNSFFFEKETEVLNAVSQKNMSSWLGKKWDVSGESDMTGREPITEYDLDLDWINGPYRIYNYHTIYFGLGGIIKQVMLGTGIKYNFAGNINRRMSSAVWAKLGFVF